jgi:hypothetical protein
MMDAGGNMGQFERYRYPANWDEMSKDCKDRAGWCCEHCGVEHGAFCIGEIHGKKYQTAIAACHPNNDTDNPNAVLLALCKACHMRLDGMQHARTRMRKQRELIREQQRAAGQLEMPLLALEVTDINAHIKETTETRRSQEKRSTLVDLRGNHRSHKDAKLG